MDLTEHSFPSLLAAAKTGAEWAWADIYRGLAGHVTGYLASRGATEPEDTTSEVFLQMARHIQTFDGGLSEFRSWIFVIAHRKLIDDRRARARRPEPRDVEQAEANPGGDVEDEAMRQLSIRDIRRAFETLPKAQQDVLALRIIAGLNLEETAEVLDKTVGAVKAAQHRALQSLQEQVQSEEISL
jgi:RNA polymerase sigma-70 factor (ECF subfamily)